MIMMSTSGGTPTAPPLVNKPLAQSSVWGRTRVRRLAIDGAQNTALPLGQSHEGDLHLCMVAEGRLSLPGQPPERSEPIGPGDAAIVLGTDSIQSRATAGGEILQISVPQLALESPVPLETGTVIRSDRVPMTWPVLAFTRSTLGMDSDDASSLSVYYLERLLQEMTIGILVDNARSKVMPHSPNSFTIALSVIASQCSDPALRPSRIAAQVGLSLRQLQRVFSNHNTTVEQEIRRERVEQAITMLRSPEYAALTVDQIARYVGFSNGSGLARAMTALGHPSPRRIRMPSTSTHTESD